MINSFASKLLSHFLRKPPAVAVTHCVLKAHYSISLSFNQKMSAKNNSNTLCFNDYDVFGFDLDHTLAKYNLTNLFDVSLNLF